MKISPTSLSTKDSSHVRLFSTDHNALQRRIQGIDGANMRLADMLSGPICAMVWEGRDAVKTGRGMSPIFIFN